MYDAITWHKDKLGEQTTVSLKKNNFTASYVKTKEEAAALITSLIPMQATVGMGGSWTLQEIGITEKLSSREAIILNHNRPGLTPDEVMATRRQQLTCDVFLSGTNAITLDGRLVNTDGVGNRVASMIFGPKKIIVVAGVNKIVQSIDEAITRIEMQAAPINCKRLSRNTPCTHTGVCMDCDSPDRICNVTTILHKCPSKSDIHVILVGEILGF